MDWSYLILIIPGILTEKLISSLSVRRDRNEFESLTMSVLYSFLSVCLAFITQRALLLMDSTSAQGTIPIPQISINDGIAISVELELVLFWSVVLALCSTTYLNRDLHRWFRPWLTRRETFPDTWTNFMWREQYGGAKIVMRDQRVIYGWISEFDELDKEFIAIKNPDIRMSMVDEKENFHGGRSLLLKTADVQEIMTVSDVVYASELAKHKDVRSK